MATNETQAPTLPALSILEVQVLAAPPPPLLHASLFSSHCSPEQIASTKEAQYFLESL